MSRFLKSPKNIAKSFLYHIAPFVKNDELFLKMKWGIYMNYPLNLNSPQTFNEKLQWLKLHDRKPIYTIMVDKYEAKKYVANIIGEEHIIPTLAVYDSVEEIAFDALPNQFVLKCTHDSGGVVICKDKHIIDIEKAKEKLKRGLQKNYFYQNREWPYKSVKPRIIAEQYMSDNGKDLQDYKVHCFNGIPKVILVCKDRFASGGLTEDFYTTAWEHLDVSRPSHPNSTECIARPAELDEILVLSNKLAKGIPFVRIDFYMINHRVYFGEITFFPASGMVPFCPKNFDDLLGSWINLPVNF